MSVDDVGRQSGCGCGKTVTGRREIVKVGLGLGVGLALAPAPVFAQAANMRPQVGDVIVRDGDASLTPLTPKDIPLRAEQIYAWPMEPGQKLVRKGSRLNGLIVLRFDPADLVQQTRDRSADGVVAYTAICTHNGCDVLDWVADKQFVQCACHFTMYNPRDAAKIIDGPAPRPLPALPLQVTDGKLTVARLFTDRVGYEEA
jgi:rieske iron-sulfur protein